MNKVLKKSLSVFLAVVMMVSAVPLGGFVGLELPDFGAIFSFAANESGNNTDELEIKVNETKSIDIVGGSVTYLKFVPEKDGTYIFYSSSSSDTYGYLYDENKNQITYNDDGGEGSNFKISYALTAGVTYYWGARFYSSNNSGSFDVTLEYLCEHNYIEEITKTPNCTEYGEKLYTCEYCGKTYTESIYPTHTDNDSNGLCDICGEDAGRNILESGKCGEHVNYFFYEDGELFIYGEGQMFDYSYYSYNKPPWYDYRDSITSVVVSDGIISIGSYSFSECTKITSVIIFDSVTSIGNSAFGGCIGLKTAGPIGGDYDYQFGWTDTIPENAFSKCDGLINVTILNSVTSIGSYAFFYCTELTSITIPDSVTYIGREVFSGCTKLKTAGPMGGAYDYQFGWTDTIPDNAFSHCDGLISVTIPNSVTSIGKSAFFIVQDLQML